MTFRAPSAARSRLALSVLAGVVVLVVLGAVFVNLYTDYLFFHQVGYSRVFTTRLTTQLLLFVSFGLVMAVAVGANVTVAYLLRPAYNPPSPEQQGLERYRVTLGPYRRWAVIGVAGVFGLFAANGAAAQWQEWLLWLNGRRFGVTDPQFHRDISYYMFSYPVQRSVLSFAFSVLILSLLAVLATSYLYGGIRLQTPGEKVTAATRAHVSVLLGLIVLAKAVAYYLDRFGLNFSPRGRVTGAGYADIHATLPAKNILLVIALLCSLLFFANVKSRGFTLPGLGLGLLVLSAVVIGGIYPAIVQQFTVKPNEINLEAPYIQRNIDATQKAYSIEPSTSPGGTVTTTNFDAALSPVTGSPAVRAAAASSIANTRLLDPGVIGSTFDQLQQNRAYYTFPSTLDVDRYTLNGVTRAYLVAVRDINLSGLRPDQQNWPNEHLIYTHGIGFVAAPVDTVDPQGRPVFTVGNIPPSGPNGGPPAIAISQPRIYFGEDSPRYSIVDTTLPEIDGPDVANYNYAGHGGVSIGSTWRRLVFALRYGDRNLLLSNALTAHSRILYYRDPRVRVAKVAPWLTLDGDPYPAVIGGRIVWVLDGYTTSDMYPYSERTSLADATSNTATLTGGVSQPTNEVNYIRNSVKATVDAFSGKVTLYQFDPTDPVLRTWMKIFPGTVQPRSAISPELMAHLRYPEDLFEVQRALLARYHISDARTFYRGNDFWSVPVDPSTNGTTVQPPYYQLLALPGQPTHFDLTSAMVASDRPNLAAFVSVSSDLANYGQMQVLQLPVGTTLQGPANVATTVENNPTASKDLSLLRGGGSKTISGNLLSMPVDGGLLFVEPIYVQATQTSQTFPTLQRVAAVFGGTLGYGPTLSSAVSQALGFAAGGTSPSPSPSAGPSPGSSAGPVPAGLAALIAQAQADYAAAQAALRAGNFAGYGSDEQKLAADLAALAAQTSGSGSASLSPAPSPSGRPAPRPSGSSSPRPSPSG